MKNNFASFDDDYNEQLLDLNLENIENQVPQNQPGKRKYDSNIQLDPQKKLKSNTQTSKLNDDNLKTLFQNCEINTINVKNNYYCSCKEKQFIKVFFGKNKTYQRYSF